MGPLIQLPEFLSICLRNTLSRLEIPRQVQLVDEGGFVNSSNDKDSAKRQSLSDWMLKAEEVGEHLVVQISATLAAKTPIPTWGNFGNFWSANEGARVNIELRFDQVTRAACFGACFAGWPDEKTGTEVRRGTTSIANLKLEDAPIRPGFGFYAYTRSGWVEVTETFGSLYVHLSVRAQKRLKRTSNGFIASHYVEYPQITFDGIDLSIVSQVMRGGPSATVEFTDGRFGSVTRGPVGRDEYDNFLDVILKSTLRFRLKKSGLEFAYSLLGEKGAIVDTCVLPWEVLILRHPEFLRHKQVLVE